MSQGEPLTGAEWLARTPPPTADVVDIATDINARAGTLAAGRHPSRKPCRHDGKRRCP